MATALVAAIAVFFSALPAFAWTTLTPSAPNGCTISGTSLFCPAITVTGTQGGYVGFLFEDYRSGTWHTDVTSFSAYTNGWTSPLRGLTSGAATSIGATWSGSFTNCADVTKVRIELYDNVSQDWSVEYTSSGGICSGLAAPVPVISSVHVAPTDVEATATWLTDINADSQFCWDIVSHGSDCSGFAYGTSNGSDDLTDHSITATGLDPSTSYHYHVCSDDVCSSDDVFTTAATLELSSFYLSHSETAALMQWATNVPSGASSVCWGTSSQSECDDYDETTSLATTLTTLHAVPVSDLEPATTYYYRDCSTATYTVCSDEFSFTTPGSTPDSLAATFTFPGSGEPNECAHDTSIFPTDPDPDHVTWGDFLGFFSGMINSIQISAVSFFWADCDTFTPITELRDTMKQHAPFRQMIWLGQTTLDAINNEDEHSLSIPNFKFFPGLQAGDGDTLVLIDAQWLHDALNPGDIYDTTVMPILDALVWLELAWFFWDDAMTFFA